MASAKHNYLQTPDTANRVRPPLLAGMLPALFGTKCGGPRLQLLFRRKAFLAEARRLLAGR